MTKPFLTYFLLILVLISCQNEENKNHKSKNGFIYGKVIQIADGDTYTLLTQENIQFKIRMQGIDAPERQMPYYKVSKNYLSKLIYKKEVKLKNEGKDQYGRILAFTYLEDGTDVNLEMLKAGMVWHFKRYNKDKKYKYAEEEAREKRLGLWQEEQPIAPWDFRKEKRGVNHF